MEHPNKDSSSQLKMVSQRLERYRLLFLLYAREKNIDEFIEEERMQTENALLSVDNKFPQFQKFYFSYLIFVFNPINMLI